MAGLVEWSERSMEALAYRFGLQQVVGEEAPGAQYCTYIGILH